jgi:hypothetical protein
MNDQKKTKWPKVQNIRVSFKKRKPFVFRDKTNKEVSDLINEKYPISIRHIERIINSIHIKYPIASKTEISIVVKTFFEIIRENIILCNFISLFPIINNLRLTFFKKSNGYIVTKIKAITAKEMRKM